MYKLIVLLTFSVIKDSSCRNEVVQSFRRSELSPDVIKNPPTNFLEVIYGNNAVNLGNELTPTQVMEPPDIRYKGDSNTFYTLIVTDPDAPSRRNPIMREWPHWLITNIPDNDISNGEVRFEYIGAAPPNGTGLHRYVFLLFKQPNKLKFNEPHYLKNEGNRVVFSTEKFMAKYGLGEAIAGNFYEAQYDDSVPIIHKRIGFKL